MGANFYPQGLTDRKKIAQGKGRMRATPWVKKLLNREYRPRRELQAQVISSPRIVPVAEANRSVSRPIRCNIETKRLGRG